MSASIIPPHPIAEILVRNVDALTDDERETLAHIFKYAAVKLLAEDRSFIDGENFSIKVDDITFTPTDDDRRD